MTCKNRKEALQDLKKNILSDEPSNEVMQEMKRNIWVTVRKKNLKILDKQGPTFTSCKLLSSCLLYVSAFLPMNSATYTYLLINIFKR